MAHTQQQQRYAQAKGRTPSVMQTMLRTSRIPLRVVAERCGVTIGAISSIACGRLIPSRELKAKIEATMGLPLAELTKPAVGTIVADPHDALAS